MALEKDRKVTRIMVIEIVIIFFMIFSPIHNLIKPLDNFSPFYYLLTPYKIKTSYNFQIIPMKEIPVESLYQLIYQHHALTFHVSIDTHKKSEQ